LKATKWTSRWGGFELNAVVTITVWCGAVRLRLGPWTPTMLNISLLPHWHNHTIICCGPRKSLSIILCGSSFWPDKSALAVWRVDDTSWNPSVLFSHPSAWGRSSPCSPQLQTSTDFSQCPTVLHFLIREEKTFFYFLLWKKCIRPKYKCPPTFFPQLSFSWLIWVSILGPLLFWVWADVRWHHVETYFHLSMVTRIQNEGLPCFWFLSWAQQNASRDDVDIDLLVRLWIRRQKTSMMTSS